MKNIPIPSEKEYMKKLIAQTEKIIKRMRWKDFFYDKDDQNASNDIETPNYGFKSHKRPPQHQDLQAFEHDLLKMQIRYPLRHGHRSDIRE